MNVTFLETDIFLSDDMLEYAKIYKRYIREAEKGVTLFEEMYSNNKNIEEVIERSLNQAHDVWRGVVQRSIKFLIGKGIYEVNESLFIDAYGGDLFSRFYSAHKDIELLYMSILNEEEKKDYERKLRKENRFKVIGGGFGLPGAIKGFAKAGAINVATGSIHSLSNAIGSFFSSISSNGKKRQLYNNPEVLNSLKEGLNHAILNTHLAVVDVINKCSESKINFELDFELSEKNDVILQNVLEYSPRKDKLKEILVNSVLTNPYKYDYYKIAIDYFGDPKNEVCEFADIFGIDISSYKSSLIRNYYSGLDISNESSAKRGKELLERKLNSLGFDEDKYKEVYQYRKIIKTLEEFDLKYRTVDDVFFDTRQESDIARAELDIISGLLQDIELDKKEDILCKIESIKQSCVTAIGEKYIKLLEDKIEEIILKDRTAKIELGEESYSIVYDTEDEAILSRQRILELSNLIDDIDESNEEKLIKILDAIIDMKNKKAELEYDYYIDYIRSLIKKIDVELRTVDKKVYSSREEANMVKENLEKFDSINIAETLSESDLENISKEVESEDVHEDVRNLVKDRVYNAKVKKEGEREEKYNTKVGFIVIVLAAISCMFSFSVNTSISPPDILGAGTFLRDMDTTESLSLADGIKNGLMVFPRTLAESAILGFKEYIGGFGNDFISRIIWFFGGMIWLPIKHTLLFIPRYIVVLFTMLFQKGQLLYYVGYILSTIFTFKLISIAEFKKKEIKRENV